MKDESAANEAAIRNQGAGRQSSRIWGALFG
jgi:hypothetical protein